AEQLEHIQSPELVERLDQFLGRPRFDPHGDPIPDSGGRFTPRKQVLLSTLAEGDEATVVGVQDHSPSFLQYLDKMSLGLGASLRILEVFEFDGSMRISIGREKELTISSKVSGNLFVQKKG
ncbi:MAG: metal-dependent transcriptional regulator, partial [Bacteroidota bacterium]